MILTILFQVVYFLLSGLIGLLPQGGTVPVDWVNGVYTLWAGLNAFSMIVPVQMFVTCLAIALVWDLFLFGWWFLHWIIRKLPFLHIK